MYYYQVLRTLSHTLLIIIIGINIRVITMIWTMVLPSRVLNNRSQPQHAPQSSTTTHDPVIVTAYIGISEIIMASVYNNF